MFIGVNLWLEYFEKIIWDSCHEKYFPKFLEKFHKKVKSFVKVNSKKKIHLIEPCGRKKIGQELL